MKVFALDRKDLRVLSLVSVPFGGTCLLMIRAEWNDRSRMYGNKDTNLGVQSRRVERVMMGIAGI